MNRVDWTAVYDTLQRVERLAPEDSGLLSFGIADEGAIFVEQGRICWVAARGLGQRLGDLLVASSSVDEAELRRVTERCRLEGKLVGQALVAEGLIQPAELERALRRHSAECLLDLCRDPLPTRWASHSGRGYAPRFTVRPTELLFDAVALAFPAESARAQRELSALAAPGRRAVAFVYDDANQRLLPAGDTGAHSVVSLRTLAHVASAMPLASLELATTPSFTLAATEEGRAVAVWWRDGLLFAVPCDDRTTLAAVTARVLAAA